MRKLLTISAITVLLFSCNSSKQSTVSDLLTSEEKKEGWKLLFDGKSSAGWHKYGGGAIDSVWKVKDGVLCLETLVKKQFKIKGDWDIVTDEEYDNFHLQLEWKISKNGNSGIIFFIHEDKPKYNWPWETGMEMQVLDNDGHPDAKIVKHRAGDLYDLISSSKETVKAVGEWNLAEIKCVNGQLDLFLNGEKVVSTILWDDNWKKLVAGSKFRSMPAFSTYRKGRIGLQDHGDEVCYRNIKIRKM
ncbi:MAG: DUF1080 domain-containing protein [Bacteroidota bacterium]|nr:DUF1080 domain-containing protein [Bacteroidota bacterium]